MQIDFNIAALGFVEWSLMLCLSRPALPQSDLAQQDRARQDLPRQVLMQRGASAPDGEKSPDPVVGRELDRVIAVVNNQVILESDLELELRLTRLLPFGGRADLTPVKGLERLITRALIERQIIQEDPHGLEIAPSELAPSLVELRQRLPACKRRDCATEAGWRAYLATLDLTPGWVADYWANRLAVLRFIEQRFRSGIRIAPEEIEKYYREALVPEYPNPADAPGLDEVSQRIQEILLQQQVNALMDDWLKSLQDQGQVEILDVSLRAAAPGAESNSVAPNSGPALPGGLTPQGGTKSGSGSGADSDNAVSPTPPGAGGWL